MWVYFVVLLIVLLGLLGVPFMSRDESLDAEETPAGAEGPGLRKRLFDSYAGELSAATSRYMLGVIGPSVRIATVR